MDENMAAEAGDFMRKFGRSTSRLSQIRIRLKAQLVSKGEKCFMCGGDGTHMHEGLISRAVVRSSNLQPEIMTRYNCVLVCPGECHQLAHTEHGRILAAKHLLDREGYEPIVQWAEELAKKQKIDYCLQTVKYYLTEAQND